MVELLDEEYLFPVLPKEVPVRVELVSLTTQFIDASFVCGGGVRPVLSEYWRKFS